MIARILEHTGVETDMVVRTAPDELVQERTRNGFLIELKRSTQLPILVPVRVAYRSGHCVEVVVEADLATWESVADSFTFLVGDFQVVLSAARCSLVAFLVDGSRHNDGVPDVVCAFMLFLLHRVRVRVLYLPITATPMIKVV